MFELEYLEKERTYSSDTGVVYIDLPRNERIAMLMVECSVTNTAPTSRDYTRTILDVITNVDVLLEGSAVAFSAPPEVGGFMALARSGQVPPYDVRERGRTYVRLPIYFQRHPMDMAYMLDTSQYSSAQLQISYTLNTTYETSGSFQVTAWYLRPIEQVTPRGFVRSRVVNKYTTSGSAEVKEVDLPTGLPVLEIGTRIWDIDQFIENNVTDLKLDIDEGRQVLFDGRIEDLKLLNRKWYGPELVGPRYWALTQNGQYVQHLMADPEQLVWSHYAAAAIVYGSSAIWSNRHQLQATGTDDSASTTNRDFVVQAKGGHLFSCLSLLHRAEEPYPLDQHADALIEYTIGAYTIEIETFVQELVEGRL